MSQICCIQAPNFLLRYTIGVKQSEIVHLECHNFYELYFYKAGGVEYSIEGKKYTLAPNTLLFMAPQVFHGYTVNNSDLYERYVISFKKEFLSAESLHYCNLLFDSSAAPTRHHCFPAASNYYIDNFFNNLVNCQQMTPALRDKALASNFDSLLFQIYHMYHCNLNVGKPYTDLSTTPNKINSIILFLNEHIHETITLDSISDHFYISKHHLNKIFRDATGTTIIKYVLYKKITLAQQLIQNNTPITQAAITMGFSDYSNFYRNYLNIIGHAPHLDIPT